MFSEIPGCLLSGFLVSAESAMPLPGTKLKEHEERESEPDLNYSLARELVEDVVEHIRLGGHGYEAMGRATGWPAVGWDTGATSRRELIGGSGDAIVCCESGAEV